MVGTTQMIGPLLRTNPISQHLSGLIGYSTMYVNINQIREIAGRLFAQHFRTQFEEVNGYPSQADTPHPSIPELEDSLLQFSSLLMVSSCYLSFVVLISFSGCVLMIGFIA